MMISARIYLLNSRNLDSLMQ